MKKNARTLITILSLTGLSLSAEAITVTFKDKFFGRTSADFSAQNEKNIDTVLRPGVQTELVGKMKTAKGNYGLQVKVLNGEDKGKTLWVYYGLNNPQIRLMDGDKSISVEQASITKSSATAAAPVTAKPVVKTVENKIATTKSQTVAQTSGDGFCSECSRADNGAPEVAPIQKVLEKAYPSAFKGALKTMAVMYQSCQAIAKAPYDFKTDISDFLSYRQMSSELGHSYKTRTIPEANANRVVKNHYYLKDMTGPENNQCADMRKRPPLYTYGGAPAVKGKEINMLVSQQRSGAPYSGMDCSAFVSTAMSAAGLRLKPNMLVAENRATSTTLASFSERNSCFARPKFTPENTLQPGDVIAYSGHTFMIDTVGNDPFGFNKMKSDGIRLRNASDCKRLPTDFDEYFDFRLIQSAGMGSLAISRTEASKYISRARLGDRMRPLAIQACVAHVTGQSAASFSSAATLLRHRGSEIPGCVMSDSQKPHLTGEQCVASCT